MDEDINGIVIARQRKNCTSGRTPARPPKLETVSLVVVWLLTALLLSGLGDSSPAAQNLCGLVCNGWWLLLSR